tara:strand:- start:2317 stop:3270 length:954 start_codon:yes stop_codon:yes gene_type:complete
MNINCPNSIIDIYNAFKNEYNFNEKDCLLHEHYNYNVFNDTKNKLTNDSDFDFNFIIDYFNLCRKCYTLHYENVVFNILCENKLNKKSINKLCKNIYRVYLTAKLYNINKNFVFFIVLYPGKRKLPKNNSNINAVNINGGFTYCKGSNIYIIREQDYEKVILHELLHHNIIMHHEEWSYENINMIKKKCNISKEQILIPNEAIIELFGCLLNVIFYSIETGKNFKKLLKIDIDHSLKIAKRVLEFQGQREWYEFTNCYCYVILKTILYKYIHSFLKIYKCNNDTDITNFLIENFSKFKRVIKRIKKDNSKSLKQTAF